MGSRSIKALSLKAESERLRIKALSLKKKAVGEVRRIATYLCDTFHDEKSMNFYLKCSWHLSEQFLVDLVCRAKKKNHPKYYFFAVASREMNG